MKLSLKHIYICSLIGLGASTLASCNDFLDREPITNVTPEAYFTTVDQVGAYVINYYSYLQNSRQQSLYHDKNWRSGMTLNDNNTDNLFSQTGDLDYFAGEKQVPSGKNFQTYTSRARVWNWLLEQILPKEEAGSIQGDKSILSHYIGEAYFFRALAYYQALVRYGDFPIIDEVLPDDQAILKELSQRAPRNEVARFILKDLDTAISRLKDQGFQNNQRINKQTAQLLKSRVALFEATFEKYHKGTGRVPGDDTWPGKDMEYNQGKTFDIAGEINFFLTEAMSAALGGVDSMTVTPFDKTYETPDEFSERLARNQQLLLKEESHFDKVIDPAAGSYYIENLTVAIAKQAWELFLAVEEAGGFYAALKAGTVQAAVNESNKARHKAVAQRREVLLGTNQFPNFNEKAGNKQPVEGKCCCGGDSHTCEKEVDTLVFDRAASQFEALRLETEASGKRPKAFMLTIGNLAMRQARAQYSCNFLACAGYEVIDNLGFETVEAGVEAAIAAKADIVVICSSDDEYAEYAIPAFKALNGRAMFIVAGAPACMDDLKAAGIENFIHVRVNVLDTLKEFNAKLLK